MYINDFVRGLYTVLFIAVIFVDLGKSLGWDGGMDGNGGLNNAFFVTGRQLPTLKSLLQSKKKKNKNTTKPRIFPRLLVAQCRHATKFWASCRLEVVV